MWAGNDQDAENVRHPVLFIWSIRSIWSVWFIWIVSFVQTDETDWIDLMDQTDRTCLGSAGYRKSGVPKWFFVECESLKMMSNRNNRLSGLPYDEAVSV